MGTEEIEVPESRYICENVFDEEFDPVMDNDGEEHFYMEAYHGMWDKMVAYATALADKPEDWYRHLWTRIDGDDGTDYLVNGTRFVNRDSFYFTRKPWGIDNNKRVNDLSHIEVAWSGQEDCEEK